MKAAAFDYVCPGTVAEVCGLLADAGGEARIIAGGQTLVPLMATRLARPLLLVDINRVDGLQGIQVDDACQTIKAGTRQRRAERSPDVGRFVPLLARALPFVGHLQIRNRGTVGGSLANADPAAEIPLVATALDAELVAVGPEGERRISARDFFTGTMTTALADAKCLTEVRFPHWPENDRIGAGFQEVAAREGDFAIAAAAVQLAVGGDGVCRGATVAVGGVAPTPVCSAAAADCLVGRRIDPGVAREAAALASEGIASESDLHASAELRRRLAPVLVERAILEAWQTMASAKARP